MDRRPPPVASGTAVRGQRRWLRAFWVLLLLLGVLLYFVPALATRAPFRDALIQSFLPAHLGKLQVDQITAGWNTPIAARGIRFNSGSVQFTAHSISSNRTAWELVRNPSDLGRWQGDSFEVTLVAAPESRAGGSEKKPSRVVKNAVVIDAPARKNPRTVAIEFHANGGNLKVERPGSKPVCVARDIQICLEAPTHSDQASVSLIARTGDPRATAHCSAQGTLRWPPHAITDSVIDAHLDLVGVDLSVIREVCTLAGLIGENGQSSEDGSWPQVEGTLIGNTQFRTGVEKSLEIRANLHVQDFALTSLSRDLEFRRPSVSATGVANLTSSELRIEAARVCTDGITIDGSGAVRDLTGQAHADLSGSTLCDWQVLKNTFQQQLPDEIDVRGCDRRPWLLRGPLRGSQNSEFESELEVQAATHIAALHLFGLDFGPLELSAHWARDQVQFEPVDLDFRQGRICVQPAVSLTKAAPVLSLTGGRVIKQVAIDPKLCDWLLRYVDPLSTISSNLHGQISLELEHFEMPLVHNGIREGSFAGRVLLENVQFAPDESLRELFAMAGISCQANISSSQNIEIRLKHGRVHHSGLALPIGNDHVTLDGWVGLDQTMNIRVSLPVTEQMLGKDKRLYRLLRGQRIEVPVTGTLEDPKVNQEALARNIQRLVQLGLRDSLSGDDPLRGILRRALK